jgi:hypothetical protein
MDMGEGVQFVPDEVKMINEKSQLYQDFIAEGGKVNEVKSQGNPIYGVGYEYHPTEAVTSDEMVTAVDKPDMIFIPGVTSEGVADINAHTNFIKTLHKNVGSLFAVNSHVSMTALKERLSEDPEKVAINIVDLYEKYKIMHKEKDVLDKLSKYSQVGYEGPENMRPAKGKVLLSAHSMGTVVAAHVAKELTARGYEVDDLFLFEPIGLAKTNPLEVGNSFLSLAKDEHYDIDISRLYPCAGDIRKLDAEYQEYLKVKDTLSLKQQQAIEADYQLVRSRLEKPDVTLLGILSPADKEELAKLDTTLSEIAVSSRYTEGEKDILLATLMETRFSILRPYTHKLAKGEDAQGAMINATVNAYDQTGLIKGLAHHPGEVFKFVRNLGKDALLQSLQSLVDFVNKSDRQRSGNLHITVVAGRKDPLMGVREKGTKTENKSEFNIGNISDWQIGPEATYTEIALDNVDHMSLATDSLHAALLIKDELEKRVKV